MLVIKVYVNNKQIDKIKIHNIGEFSDGHCKYHIVEPANNACPLIIHKRDNGYKPLLIEALKVLINEEDTGP